MAVGLLACSNKKEKPSAPPASRSAPKAPSAQAKSAEDRLLADLMRAVFGRAYDSAKAVAVAELPDPEDRTSVSVYAITALNQTVLRTGETLLLANALAMDENGKVIDSHATSGLLNLYVLIQQDGQWKTVRRHHNFDALGSFGSPGVSRWVRLGPGKTGLAMIHGGTWQGHTIELLSLYDVSKGNLRKLIKDNINIHSDNNGACLPVVSCWDVSGEWKLLPGQDGSEYDDLVINFKGTESDPVEGATEDTSPDIDRPDKPVKAQARYRFDGTTYKLSEGANPVPSI